MGTMGVEWFATKEVSFHAEYFAFLEYSSSDSQYTDTSVLQTRSAGRSGDAWRFDGVNVLLGISIYF